MSSITSPTFLQGNFILNAQMVQCCTGAGWSVWLTLFVFRWQGNNVLFLLVNSSQSVELIRVLFYLTLPSHTLNHSTTSTCSILLVYLTGKVFILTHISSVLISYWLVVAGCCHGMGVGFEVHYLQKDWQLFGFKQKKCYYLLKF